MDKLKVLDCTLRDGGYVNNWNFGINNINFILKKLVESNVEIIECGFLKEQIKYNEDKTLFDSIERIKSLIPKKVAGIKFVCMVNYGEYEINNIPENDGTSVDGIRVVFHKKDAKKALEFSKKISQKGYLVFIQPMVTINYSDRELLSLLDEVNKIKPYAFYIVDSFGVMKKKDLLRMSYLIDNNLSTEVRLGYHSHNNLQLSYSNAQSFKSVAKNRSKIIDSSIYGMGRGAGNLNTELFLEYLNQEESSNYNIEPLLEVIDDVLNNIYKEKQWGYSLPHYLSAVWNCHPNYGAYLDELNTLTVKSIHEILSKIDISKKDSFNKDYIQNLYLTYQDHCFNDEESIEMLKKKLVGKEILLLAPGKTLEKEKEKIVKYIEESNPFIISINFSIKDIESDLTFVSNEKRYTHLDNINNLVITSNIKGKTNKNEIIVNYLDLLVDNKEVKDNSALMLLNLLVKAGIKKITIAGLDGYTLNNEENYLDRDLMLFKSIKNLNELNYAISEELHKVSKNVELNFLTFSKYSLLMSYQNEM